MQLKSIMRRHQSQKRLAQEWLLWWGLLPKPSSTYSRANLPSILQLWIPSLVMSSWMRSMSFAFILFNFFSNIVVLSTTFLLISPNYRALEQQWEGWDVPREATADFYNNSVLPSQGQVAKALELMPTYLWSLTLPCKGIHWQGTWSMAEQGLILGWGKRYLSLELIFEFCTLWFENPAHSMSTFVTDSLQLLHHVFFSASFQNHFYLPMLFDLAVRGWRGWSFGKGHRRGQLWDMH